MKQQVTFRKGNVTCCFFVRPLTGTKIGSESSDFWLPIVSGACYSYKYTPTEPLQHEGQNIMTTTTMPQRKQDLIKALYQERVAAGLVTAAQGVPAIIAAYNDGATIKELVTFHKHYSKEYGRVFPFFEEDFQVDADGFVRPGEAYPEDAALENVAYHWDILSNLSTNFANFAYNLAQMENSISDLISFHPDYDEEHGEIY
jgi:hypothetical protein